MNQFQRQFLHGPADKIKDVIYISHAFGFIIYIYDKYLYKIDLYIYVNMLIFMYLFYNE